MPKRAFFRNLECSYNRCGIMNVMLHVDDLIIHLERKITEYRYHQKRTQKAKTDIRTARELLTSLRTELHQQLNDSFKAYRSQLAAEVGRMEEFFTEVVGRVRAEREAEVCGLHCEIERQHRVISDFRKEVEGLQVLMEMQAVAALHDPAEQTPHEEGAEQEREESPPRTFGGLEVIEEETERTLMSSARSNREERAADQFIRIEEQEEDAPSFHRQTPEEFRLASCGPSEQSPSSASSRSITALSKLEQLLEVSHFTQRVHSVGEEGQYESLPLSMEPRAECATWEGGSLKDITNDEQERQSRSKMFLEEFRRTFDKCLSSTSRKNSAKDPKDPKDPRDKARTPREPIPERDSQRMISEMLRDIDNNNKFYVGARKAELRYDGAHKAGQRDGRGTLYYAAGFAYEGEFRNDLRHGYGVLRLNQAEIYRGEWQADELSGQGKIRNATAVNRRKAQQSAQSLGGQASPLARWVSYCGYFKNNRFEGEGTLYLQGGEKFLGRFICGMACGEGTLFRRNGQVETGIWRNNQLVEAF